MQNEEVVQKLGPPRNRRMRRPVLRPKNVGERRWTVGPAAARQQNGERRRTGAAAAPVDVVSIEHQISKLDVFALEKSRDQIEDKGRREVQVVLEVLNLADQANRGGVWLSRHQEN